MDIERRINELEVHLNVMKLYANSYYTILSPEIPSYIGIDGEKINDYRMLLNERIKYKIEKKSLLKKLERKQKLQKINEVQINS